MKKLVVLSLGVMMAFASAGVAPWATAGESAEKSSIKSGPKGGDYLGPFNVTKVGGAKQDGVKEGDKLCYRCKNSSRPQVIVFTRSTDSEVAQLVSRLDKALAEHEDAQLRSFVNVLGEDPQQATEAAKKFAMSSQADQIPFVVPSEFENGPADYGINPKAAVTVVLAADGKVKASHGFASASDVCLDTVMKGVDKIVK